MNEIDPYKNALYPSGCGAFDFSASEVDLIARKHSIAADGLGRIEAVSEADKSSSLFVPCRGKAATPKEAVMREFRLHALMDS